MTKNEEHDKKLLERGSRHIRLGDYTTQLVKILYRCTVCGTESLKTPKHVLGRDSCKTCAVSTTKFTNKIYDDKIANSTYVRLAPYVGANIEILHKCKVCNSEHLVRPASIIQGHGCKFCQNRILKTTDVYRDALNYRGIEVLGEYTGNKTNILHRCKTCSNTWNASPNNVLSKESGCPCCAKEKSVSSGELELREFISNNYTGWVEFNDRTLIAPNELDIVLPDLGIAIEYNGVYWHSTARVHKTYHLEKTNSVEDVGFRLIHVQEDEWKYKPTIVKSRLINILGKSKRLFARKCAVEFIDTPVDFLNNNHIQGYVPSSISLGLFLDDENVAVMTFGKPRFSTNYDYELLRYCSILNTTIVGGASKLLRAFRNRYSGSIVSYADRRWSSGNLYKSLGFEFSHNSEPNYRYYKGLTSLSRYSCQKHKLVGQGYDSNMTEVEIMTSRGYVQVFDCGNSVWVLK